MEGRDVLESAVWQPNSYEAFFIKPRQKYSKHDSMKHEPKSWILLGKYPGSKLHV